jgi:epoxyqueuosine reductase
MKKLKKEIKKKAFSLGFDKVGFARAEDIEGREREFSLKWLNNNYHGEMSYMERNFEKRMSPQLLFPGTKTVISLATNYFSGKSAHPLFSKYVTARDYHLVIKKRLKKLSFWLGEQKKGIQSRFFTDSAPVLEKYWAQKAGVGWLGKNACLITKEFGSWVFLSEIFLNIEIQPDTPHKNYCGSCHKCIESCPNGAILKPGILDAGRCISYLTIEKKTELTPEEKELVKSYVFGCDICQDVCPWNQKTPVKSDLELAPLKKIENMNNNDLLTMDERTFNEFFRGTVVKRVPFNIFKDNLRCIINR